MFAQLVVGYTFMQQLCHFIFNIRFCEYRFKLPESPRWLLVNGRIEELVKVIEVAAYWNKITLPENYEKTLQKPEPETVSFARLFAPQYLRTTFLMIIVWYALILLYFGITLHLNNLGGDIYLNSVCIRVWGFGCLFILFPF